MMISLSKVLSEQHETIEENVLPEITQFHASFGDYEVIGKEPFIIRIEYVEDNMLTITGNSKVKVLIPCARCLSDVKVEIPLTIEKKVSIENGQVIQAEETEETNYIDGYNLDVEQLVYNELLVGWPTKILCSEDCKGICNVCGHNLNEGACNCEDTSLDPRMSVIRDVFKNFKEV